MSNSKEQRLLRQINNGRRVRIKGRSQVEVIRGSKTSDKNWVKRALRKQGRSRSERKEDSGKER